MYCSTSKGGGGYWSIYGTIRPTDLEALELQGYAWHGGGFFCGNMEEGIPCSWGTMQQHCSLGVINRIGKGCTKWYPTSLHGNPCHVSPLVNHTPRPLATDSQPLTSHRCLLANRP